MDALNSAAQTDFHGRLLIFLRKELPNETAEFSEDALLMRIVQSEAKAAKYGVVTDLGITQFVCLTFTAGPNFDEIPAINEYLKEPSDDPDERLNLLVEEFLSLEDEGDGNQ